MISNPEIIASARLRRLCVKLSAFAVATLFATAATGQEISIDLGGEGALTLQVVQLILLITVLSLAPGILVMATCFPFIVTVLSILRQAIGVQQAPPNMLIVSLALFLTYFVMAPTFDVAWRNGVQPLTDGALSVEAAFREIIEPFRVFMTARVDAATISALSEAAPHIAATEAADDATPLSLLVPSFILSEIKRAFEIGFLVFLPFLVIDLVVASILMSMGMMMVPPAVVALPFKLSFFVLADGWTLLAGALVRGYST